MILAGWLLGLWTNYVQFTLGRGTPVPVMATQKLLICPPYSFCRNPMALGAIVAYLGVSVVAGSPGAGLLWLLGAVALLTYIRLIEERRWSPASARRTWPIAAACRSSSPGCAGVAEGCGFGACRETGASVRLCAVALADPNPHERFTHGHPDQERT